MNLKAVVKGGLINGLAIALSLHWMILALLYEIAYEFEWPSIVSGLNILAVMILLVALLSIGPCAVLLSKGNVKTKKQGFIVGAGAGLIVGLMVYLAVGALANTLVLGTIPLIAYLAEPNRLNGIESADEVLRPVVRSAIVGTYLVSVAHLLIGALIGGVEGLAFILVRSWRLGRRTGLTAKQGGQT
jgi:hypothetical protein